jgi:hypothetical protein
MRIFLAVALVLGGGYVAWEWGPGASVYTAAVDSPSSWEEPTPVNELDRQSAEAAKPPPPPAPDSAETSTEPSESAVALPTGNAVGQAPATVVAQAGDAVLRQIIADAEKRGERRALAREREQSSSVEPTPSSEDEVKTKGKNEDASAEPTTSESATTTEAPNCVPSSSRKSSS